MSYDMSLMLKPSRKASLWAAYTYVQYAHSKNYMKVAAAHKIYPQSYDRHGLRQPDQTQPSCSRWQVLLYHIELARVTYSAAHMPGGQPHCHRTHTSGAKDRKDAVYLMQYAVRQNQTHLEGVKTFSGMCTTLIPSQL